MKKNIAGYKILYYLIPSIISLLVLRSYYLGHTYKIDVWQAGGMRMFSTIDYHSNRSVRIKGKIQNTPVVFSINKKNELYSKSVRSRIFPSDANIRNLAMELEKEIWCLDSTGKAYTCTNGNLKLKIEEITIYKLNFDSQARILKNSVVKMISL